jgi:hypothetical protein
MLRRVWSVLEKPTTTRRGLVARLVVTHVDSSGSIQVRRRVGDQRCRCSLHQRRPQHGERITARRRTAMPQQPSESHGDCLWGLCPR